MALADGLVDSGDATTSGEDTPEPEILLSSPVAEPEPDDLGAVGETQPDTLDVAVPVETVAQTGPEPDLVTEDGPENVVAPEAETPLVAEQTPVPVMENLPIPETVPAPADLSPEGEAPADVTPFDVPAPVPANDGPATPDTATQPVADHTAAPAPDEPPSPVPETVPAHADLSPEVEAPADETPFDVPALVNDGPESDPTPDTETQPVPDYTPEQATPPVPETGPAPAELAPADPAPAEYTPAEVPASEDVPLPAAPRPVRAAAPAGPKQTPIERLRALRAPPKPGKRKK